MNWELEKINTTFNELKITILDLGYEYKRAIKYIGSETIRISFIKISKGKLLNLKRDLTKKFPNFVFLRGKKKGTLIVFLEGPGYNSPYREVKQ